VGRPAAKLGQAKPVVPAWQDTLVLFAQPDEVIDPQQ
jgi:hypothetical protein